MRELPGRGPKDFKRTQEKIAGKDAIKFAYTSKDGGAKFPGTVDVTVWYTESQKEKGSRKESVLTIEYGVQSNGVKFH
jgi:galactose mutarotase-like enzyme